MPSIGLSDNLVRHYTLDLAMEAMDVSAVDLPDERLRALEARVA